MRNLLYILLLLLGLASCSTEVEQTGDATDRSGLAHVSFRITAASNADGVSHSLRSAFGDDEATAGEFMKSWFVAVVQGGKVIDIIQKTLTDEKAEDVVADKYAYTPGETHFYAFANLTPTEVGLTKGAALPTDFENSTIKAVGNVSQLSDFTSGIPMSGRKTVTLTQGDATVDLQVVRLVSKVNVKVTNDTGSQLTLNSITLSDITQNNALIGLFPLEQADTLAPNLHLSADTDRGDYTYSLTTDNTLANGETKTLSFYVNESQAHKPDYFILNLNTTSATTGTTSTQRMAMLKWKSISRNDSRTIPVTLCAFKVSYEVEAYSPIGVIPQATYNEGKLLVNFQTYGEFHVRPIVTNLKDNSTLTQGSATGWTFNSFTTLEANPAGGNGVSIFDVCPSFNASNNLIGGMMGLREGYSIHELNLTIPKAVTGGSNDLTLATRLEFNMDASLYTGFRSAHSAPNDGNRCWQKVMVEEPNHQSAQIVANSKQ